MNEKDIIIVKDAIQTLREGVFGVDVFNAEQLIEVLKAFEPSLLHVGYIHNFIYIRRCNNDVFIGGKKQ